MVPRLGQDGSGRPGAPLDPGAAVWSPGPQERSRRFPQARSDREGRPPPERHSLDCRTLPRVAAQHRAKNLAGPSRTLPVSAVQRAAASTRAPPAPHPEESDHDNLRDPIRDPAQPSRRRRRSRNRPAAAPRRMLNLPVPEDGPIAHLAEIGGDDNLIDTIVASANRYPLGAPDLHAHLHPIGEWGVILDALRQPWTADPQLVAQLPKEIGYAIDTDRLDLKWRVDGQRLRSRLNRMSFGERMAIGEMTLAFWRRLNQGASEDGEDLIQSTIDMFRPQPAPRAPQSHTRLAPVLLLRGTDQDTMPDVTVADVTEAPPRPAPRADPDPLPGTGPAEPPDTETSPDGPPEGPADPPAPADAPESTAQDPAPAPPDEGHQGTLQPASPDASAPTGTDPADIPGGDAAPETVSTGGTGEDTSNTDAPVQGGATGNDGRVTSAEATPVQGGATGTTGDVTSAEATPVHGGATGKDTGVTSGEDAPVAGGTPGSAGHVTPGEDAPVREGATGNDTGVTSGEDAPAAGIGAGNDEGDMAAPAATDAPEDPPASRSRNSDRAFGRRGR